ncbi:MAG TPA: hypothetical protein VFB45_10685 [Pseudolabrys sp.]|nr:hypothetical protein [Pseudolabrys sp.]
MALFARKSRGGNWESLTADGPFDLSFPTDVLADMLDGANEVSVWRVEDPPGVELEILAAALHAKSVENLTDVTFRFISDWQVKEKLRLQMRQTPGESVDTPLNKSGAHWVIETNCVDDAIRLAHGFKQRSPRTLNRAAVMRRFALSIQEKRISDQNIAPRLWKRLIDDGYLAVVAEPEVVAEQATPANR